MGSAEIYVLLFGTCMQLIQIVGKNRIRISQIVAAVQALKQDLRIDNIQS